MNKKVIIEVLAALVGIAAGAATAYYGKDPQAGAAIGGAVYLASRGLGYVDPGTSIPQVSVTAKDIADVEQAIRDEQARNFAGLAGDLATVASDVKTVLAQVQPAADPAPVPAAAPAIVTGPNPAAAAPALG